MTLFILSQIRYNEYAHQVGYVGSRRRIPIYPFYPRFTARTRGYFFYRRLHERSLRIFKSLLERYPETRDDDMKLYARACWEDYGSINPKGANFYTVLYHHDKYKLPNYESITRARRRVQQNEEHLRGSRYQKRQNEERKYRDHYGSNQS